MEKSEDKLTSSQRLVDIANMAAPAPAAIPEAVPAEKATEVQEPQEVQDAEDGEQAAAEHGAAEVLRAAEAEAQDEPPCKKARASADARDLGLAPDAGGDEVNAKVASSTRLGQKTSAANVGAKAKAKAKV